MVGFESDFRVGGAERQCYRFEPDTAFSAAEPTSDGVYYDIVDRYRIVACPAWVRWLPDRGSIWESRLGALDAILACHDDDER